MRLAPYIWTHQFTLLSPSTCFVLDDGNGRAVGYCIGAPDITAFCEAYPRYVKDILEGRGKDIGDIRLFPTDEQLETRAPWIDPDTGRVSELCLSQLAFSADLLLLRGYDDLYQQGYRATMHIDLLDEFQGKGWGRKLLEKVVGSMKEVEMQAPDEKGTAKGVWLGVGGENAKVVPFYERLGFRVMERQQTSTTIIMVRDY